MEVQCSQLVSIESCCDPEQCMVLATIISLDSGAALCEEHANTAHRYSTDGQWDVGRGFVPFPERWQSIDGTPLTPPEGTGATQLETITLDGGGSGAAGLVVETEPLDALIIEAEPRAN